MTQVFDLGQIKPIEPGDTTTPCTYWIDPDEKVLQFVELNLTPMVASKRGYKYDPFTWAGNPRMRIAWVNRGDIIHEYQAFSPHAVDAPPLRIVALWENSYAQVCEIADEWVTNHCQWEKDLGLNLLGESRLMEQFLEQLDEEERQLKNASTLGPFLTIQRNEIPEVLQRRVRRKGV